MKICHLRTILYCLIILCTGLPSFSTGHLPKRSIRVKYNFNPGWRICTGDPEDAETPQFDDSDWEIVTLPRAFNEDEAFRKSIHELTTGIVWYRKHFKIPARYKDNKIFLEFEGIRQAGAFYLNGRYIGLHENGVMAFGFDITSQVKFAPEENIIAIRIDNSWDYKEKSTGQPFQWNNNNFNANYGGIPKNVYLHITGKLYQTLPLFSTLETTGVYIHAGDFNIPGRSARITAASEVKNENDHPVSFHYLVVVKDITEKTVAQFNNEEVKIGAGKKMTVTASADVRDLEFWSWGYGYLYDVYTILRADGKNVDIVKTKTGFRKTEFRDGMVLLNDRVIQLKGYAQRTSNEWPALGMSVPPWISDFSNRLIIKGNGNLVRWMHVTPWKQDVESCDRLGLIEAMPAGDAEKDVNDRRWEQRVELMRDAIIYNRNNPSIVFYECGNESISEEHMQEMKDLRDKFDPYGGRAIGSREMLDSKTAEYGGEMLYINKSARQPMWAMEYMRDEGLRKYWDNHSPPFHTDGAGPLYRNRDASAYNRNQDSYALEAVKRWYDYWRERPGTGKRVSSGGANIIFSDSNTHFRGKENYRRSGEVDALRIPKDGYFAHRVMWDGWVDPEKHHTHIVGHWNYNDTTVKDVYVISTADRVELKLNDVSMGFGEQSYRFLFTFKDVQWLPGMLEAVGYDCNGNMLASDIKITTGKPTGIRLTLHTSTEGFMADGADLALVDIEVTDAAGNRCPVSNRMINYELTGPAEWRGGLAQGPDNYILSESLPVECGISRVIIRSTCTAGKIVLNVTADGLKPASISLKSKPVKVKGGLAMNIPEEKLPSFLKRGSTPESPSYKISRIPVGIKSATAGANSDNVQNSYDENELTEWTNDGRVSTGWIKYELEKRAEICEVVMKLSGWRSRRYPIRILVDNKEVYKDTTSRSLGYITIPFEPTPGTSVDIELMGAHVENDAFEEIVEISGQKELDMYREPPGDYSGQLRIVEIEFYEKPAGFLTDF
jgi:beta-galactosidase